MGLLVFFKIIGSRKRLFFCESSWWKSFRYRKITADDKILVVLTAVSNTKKNHLFQLFKKPPPFQSPFNLLCRINVKLLHKLPELRSDCKDTDLHYSIHEKQSTLSRSQFLFNIFFWLLNFSMSGSP